MSLDGVNSQLSQKDSLKQVTAKVVVPTADMRTAPATSAVATVSAEIQDAPNPVIAARHKQDYRGQRLDPLDNKLLTIFSTEQLRLGKAAWAALLRATPISPKELVRVKQLRRRSLSCVYARRTRCEHSRRTLREPQKQVLTYLAPQTL